MINQIFFLPKLQGEQISPFLHFNIQRLVHSRFWHKSIKDFLSQCWKTCHFGKKIVRNYTMHRKNNLL